MRTRAVVWSKDDLPGWEFAEVTLEPDRVCARGIAIGTAPAPYRLDYVLVTGPGFVTKTLEVTASGAGWSRRLVLRRDDAGWQLEATTSGQADLPGPGGDPSELTEAIDCDLGLSPVTNLMPILRHRLASGDGGVELTAAWVSVPDLHVLPDGQRYTALAERSVRYEALDGSFAADISLDEDGLVLDYPGIARRV